MSLPNVTSTTGWSFGTQSSTTIAGEERALYKCTPLRLFKRSNVVNPRRKPVAASFFQRMVFYQYQVNSPSKSQFHGTKPFMVENWMLVALCLNLTLGALGTYFIQVFLGIYANEQHLYLSKMVPLGLGMNGLYFYSAVLDLSRFTDIAITFLDFFINGVYNRSPWNRCDAFNISVQPKEINGKVIPFKCLELEEFRDTVLLKLGQYSENRYGYYSCYTFEKYDSCIQIPQILFMEYRSQDMEVSILTLGVYFLILWGGCVLSTKMIYRQFIWKILFYTDVAFCSGYFLAAVHTTLFPDRTPRVYDHAAMMEGESANIPIWELIGLISACFVYSPPMIHFLSARSKKVSPGKESFAMTSITVLHTIFFIMTNHVVYDYALTRMCGMDLETLYISTYSYRNIFYWLIYFGTLATGNFFSLVFLAVMFMMEYISMIITFNCFVEIYAVEYKWSRRWLMVIVITILGTINYMFLAGERYIIQFIIRLIIMILETVSIHMLYPLRRLLDDITFHYGAAPSSMRHFTIIISIAMESILLAVVVTFNGYSEIIGAMSSKFKHSAIYVSLLTFMACPVIGGVIFVLVKNVIIDQKDWTLLFVPVEEWGPSQFLPRQLRKEFDSTKFIPSRASRVLTRYLMKNAEPDTYKLDIVYEFSDLWRARKSKKMLLARVLTRYLMRNAEPDTYKLDIVYEFSDLWRARKSRKSMF